MDRRKFLSTLISGVAASAAVRTFPFQVFSFPSEIHTGNWKGLILDPYPGIWTTPYYGRGAELTPEMVRKTIEQMKQRMVIDPETERRARQIFAWDCTV